MSVEMVWKEPPPATSGKNAAILAELKKNPGRWALVNDSASSTSAPAMWKKLGCEAVHRRDETSTDKVRYHVYARWPETKTAYGQPLGMVKPNPANVVRGTHEAQAFAVDRAKRGVPEEGKPVATLGARL